MSEVLFCRLTTTDPRFPNANAYSVGGVLWQALDRNTFLSCDYNFIIIGFEPSNSVGGVQWRALDRSTFLSCDYNIMLNLRLATIVSEVSSGAHWIAILFCRVTTTYA